MEKRSVAELLDELRKHVREGLDELASISVIGLIEQICLQGCGVVEGFDEEEPEVPPM